MQRIFKLLFIGFLNTAFIIFNFSSCKKAENNASNSNVDTSLTPLGSVFSVDNKWECEIDGIRYSGTIDTSFLQVYHSEDYPDTVILCSGTNDAKNANIHFRFHLNRESGQDYNIAIQPYDALLIFDTLSTTNFLITPFNSPAQVTYTVDTILSNKLKVSFGGTLRLNPDASLDGSLHTITNGKFSCELAKGDNEPKAFSFDDDSQQVAGYFLTARLISNTLILDGLPYGPYGWETFKLQIRTGGTIKPGIYKNISGDAALQDYSPSIFKDFINDTLGNLTVAINSVEGNIIHGTFSGTDEYRDANKKISNGEFSCRVENYIPQVDSTNKWGLSAIGGYMSYRMYGGNILNAQKYKYDDDYYLTIKGESDFGASEFILSINSPTPITTGIYKSGNFANRLNSLNFNSNIFGSQTGFYVSDNYVTYCKIDFIDNYTVRGTFYGKIRNYTGGNVVGYPEIKEGTFQASF